MREAHSLTCRRGRRIHTAVQAMNGEADFSKKDQIYFKNSISTFVIFKPGDLGNLIFDTSL